MNHQRRYIIPKRNKQYKDEWDIPERGSLFTRKLYLIGQYIKSIQHEAYKMAYQVNDVMTQNMLLLLANTHHEVQEISYNKGFEGINKPKQIYECEDMVSYGFRDPYAVEYRLIMLSLVRPRNKQPLPWNNIKETILHELAHTMCNHVVYYTTKNHLNDFKTAEQIIIQLSTHDQPKQIEQQLR